VRLLPALPRQSLLLPAIPGLPPAIPYFPPHTLFSLPSLSPCPNTTVQVLPSERCLPLSVLACERGYWEFLWLNLQQPALHHPVAGKGPNIQAWEMGVSR
jgi:hypothetical protein